MTISTRYLTHTQALDFRGPCEGDTDLAGFYWTSSTDPDLDPQGPFASELAAQIDGNQNATESIIDQLKAALLAGTVTQAEVLVAMHEAVAVKDHPDHEALRDQARREYQDDETEIDDQPLFSRSEDGTWVSAWVFVYDEELEENKTEVKGEE